MRLRGYDSSSTSVVKTEYVLNAVRLIFALWTVLVVGPNYCF